MGGRGASSGGGGGSGGGSHGGQGGGGEQNNAATKNVLTYKSPSGGQVQTQQGRIDQAAKSPNEREKYEKEKAMCETLADNGHNVVHLDDQHVEGGSYDILLDGIKTDLKSLDSSSKIGRRASHAVRKQGAEMVVFELKKIDATAHREINKLIEKGIHGYYYERGSKRLFRF